MTTPEQGRVERKLAAILAADVAGYSRLTGLDEEGVNHLLNRYWRRPSSSPSRTRLRGCWLKSLEGERHERRAEAGSRQSHGPREQTS
jgi:hypothetical protein